MGRPGFREPPARPRPSDAGGNYPVYNSSLYLRVKYPGTGGDDDLARMDTADACARAADLGLRPGDGRGRIRPGGPGGDEPDVVNSASSIIKDNAK